MRNYILFALAVSITISCNKKVEPQSFFIESFDALPLHEGINYTNRANKTRRGTHRIDTIAGKKALSAILLPTIGHTAPHRAELTLGLDSLYSKNKEIWMGFNFMVPSSYELDAVNEKRGVIVYQIHSKKEEDATWDDYRKYLPFDRPSIALHLRKEGEKYFLFLMYGLNGKPNMAYSDKKWAKVAEQEIKPDVWNSIVFNYKLGFDESGFVAMWINDLSYQTTDYHSDKIYGANMHNAVNPFLKMGLYRYWNDSHEHKVLYDNLIISRERKQFLKLQNP